MEKCEQCFRWTNVTPFCDACAHRLAPAAMQVGEREHARRDRVGAEQPQNQHQALDEGRDLFRRLHRALRPQGQLAVIDMVPSDDRTGPPYALTFALNMLVNTDEGDTFTLPEISAWLKDAGFVDVRTLDAPGPSPLILATKAS